MNLYAQNINNYTAYIVGQPYDTESLYTSDTTTHTQLHRHTSQESVVNPYTHFESDSNITTSTLTTPDLPVNERPITPAADSGVITLLIAAFLFFAISYRRGAKYLQHLFSSLFKVNPRGNMFDETTINENQLKLSLLTLTFITEGITLYYSLLHQSINNEHLILPSVIICIALCAVYYLLQVLIYNLLGNIFDNKFSTETFTESFTTINLFIGLFFSPAILVMIFIPQATTIALYICFIFYLLARLLIIYKGISIFLPHLFGLLYIFLYLCALEITPLLQLKKLVIYLYKILELNSVTPWK